MVLRPPPQRFEPRPLVALWPQRTRRCDLAQRGDEGVRGGWTGAMRVRRRAEGAWCPGSAGGCPPPPLLLPLPVSLLYTALARQHVWVSERVHTGNAGRPPTPGTASPRAPDADSAAPSHARRAPARPRAPRGCLVAWRPGEVEGDVRREEAFVRSHELERERGEVRRERPCGGRRRGGEGRVGGREGRGHSAHAEDARESSARDAACPIGTGWGTRRVQLARGEGRGVSNEYGARDAASN